MPTPEEIAAQAAADAAKAAGTADADKGTPGVQEDAAVTPDPVEVTARAKGWKPKEEYTGDPGLYVDAKEFLGREPLFDRMRTLLKENKEIKKTVDAMARHFNKNVEREVNAKIAELQYQKKEAVKTGDVAQVEAIDKAIDIEKERKAEVTAPTRPEVAPDVVAWVEANPWYLKDPEMHDFAVSYQDAYMKRHPGDGIAASLDRTLEATKRAFPDKFPKPTIKPTNGEGDDDALPAGKLKVAPVADGGAGAQGGGKKYTMNRLSADQRRVYDQIVTGAKVTTHDAFFKSLDEIGELR